MMLFQISNLKMHDDRISNQQDDDDDDVAMRSFVRSFVREQWMDGRSVVRSFVRWWYLRISRRRVMSSCRQSLMYVSLMLN
jgi:hypothetical protein